MDGRFRVERGSSDRVERSLGDLVRELAADSSQLARQEIALARAELRQNFRSLARDVRRIGMGGAVAAVGALVLLAFVVALLGDLLGDQYWLGALIVGVVLVAGGGAMIWAGLKDLRTVSVAPTETIESLRNTQAWASAEATELRSVLAGEDSRGGTASTLEPQVRHGARPAPDRSLPTTTPAQPTVVGARATRTAEPGEAASGSLLKRVWQEFKDDDITGQAAKIAYYAFLAMPPALMATFGLAGLFGGLNLADTIQREAAMVLPAAVANEIVGPFIEQVVLNNAPGPLSIGLLLALWGASAVFVGLMDTLNRAYDVEETRGFVKKRATALGVMVVGALLFLLAAVSLLAGPALADAAGLGDLGRTIWTVLQWPLAFGFMVMAFWIGYYVLPNRDQSAYKKTLLKAAAGAALLWLVATAAFRLYISNFSSYSETYGFLGAFIILLLWLYVTGIVVLTGGELASEMEKQA